MIGWMVEDVTEQTVTIEANGRRLVIPCELFLDESFDVRRYVSRKLGWTERSKTQDERTV